MIFYAIFDNSEFSSWPLKWLNHSSSCISWLVMPLFYITFINHSILVDEDYAPLHSVRIGYDLCSVPLTNVPIIMQAVKKGDTIFIGKYLFTGSETASVWLEVMQSWLTDTILMHVKIFYSDYVIILINSVVYVIGMPFFWPPGAT